MNIFDVPDNIMNEELNETILKGDNIRIERIVSTGQASPKGFWYDQDEDEWVILLQGNAKIKYDDNSITTLKAGDYILIPAHKKHRVEEISENPTCVWICIFGVGFY